MVLIKKNLKINCTLILGTWTSVQSIFRMTFSSGANVFNYTSALPQRIAFKTMVISIFNEWCQSDVVYFKDRSLTKHSKLFFLQNGKRIFKMFMRIFLCEDPYNQTNTLQTILSKWSYHGKTEHIWFKCVQIKNQ